jgi:hypothetical protein
MARESTCHKKLAHQDDLARAAERPGAFLDGVGYRAGKSDTPRFGLLPQSVTHRWNGSAPVFIAQTKICVEIDLKRAQPAIYTRKTLKLSDL